MYPLLLPSTTMIRSRPSLTPLEIRQFPAAYVNPVFIPLQHSFSRRSRFVFVPSRTIPQPSFMRRVFVFTHSRMNGCW